MNVDTWTKSVPTGTLDAEMNELLQGQNPTLELDPPTEERQNRAEEEAIFEVLRGSFERDMDVAEKAEALAGDITSFSGRGMNPESIWRVFFNIARFLPPVHPWRHSATECMSILKQIAWQPQFAKMEEMLQETWHKCLLVNSGA